MKPKIETYLENFFDQNNYSEIEIEIDTQEFLETTLALSKFINPLNARDFLSLMPMAE